MKKLSALIASGGIFLASASNALADNAINIDPCASNATGVSFGTLCGLSLNGGVVSRVITIALVVATLIALAFLIYGGIRWILSGGEKEKVEEARGTIIAALVGLVITFLAYFLINIVFNLFGIGQVGDINGVPLLDVFTNP
jgi:hypothetical protein